MEYGICHLSVIPVRMEPDDGSEMVTQILFGEVLQVLSAQKQWRKIKCSWDGYEGWIDEKQFIELPAKEAKEAMTDAACSLEISHSVTNQNHHIPILIGSSLPHYDGINFKLYKHKYWFNGQAYRHDLQNNKRELLAKIALKYQYAPYLWGGRSPYGVDCSGLTQTVFKILGFALNRDAYQQAEQGSEISFTGETQPGDLAFFENKAGKIAHVGIILGENKIIHAYGQVRIDKLDHFGIYNDQKKKYTHQLRLIKRIL